MKNILLLTLISLGFTSCNSSGGGKETIAITVQCNSTDDTSNYQVLKSGDVISKQETLKEGVISSVPKVEIFHSEDGMKKVCLKSGTAIILR